MVACGGEEKRRVRELWGVADTAFWGVSDQVGWGARSSFGSFDCSGCCRVGVGAAWSGGRNSPKKMNDARVHMVTG